MANKKNLTKFNLGLTIAIVIGILAVVNFFAYNIFYRFDLTQNKDYSISKASKTTVSDLKDIVNIKAYFSADLPSQYLRLRQEVADILEEYVNYSSGKIKVEFISPTDDEATQRDLYLAGIPQLQFNTLEKDKYQVVNGYLGLQIKYGEKSQAIPVIEGTQGLEYQVTSAIKKLTSEQIAQIAFWQGNQTAEQEKDIKIISEKLAEVYEVTQFDYKSEKAIPAGVDILFIIGPKEKFSDQQLKEIDAFLIRGGSVVILADGVNVEQGLVASKNEIGLSKFLEAYGVKLNNDLLLDVFNGMASFSQGFVTFSTNYPYWPKVIKQGFDQNNLAVSKLESLVLPWASTIEISPEKTAGLKISYLARSSSRAMAVADKFQLSPQAEISEGKRGQFNLAVSLSGKFNSAFKNTGTKEGKLILVGDSDFIRDNFLGNYPDNLLFLQNVVDSLSLGDDLITIRSKGVTERPLKEISEPVKTAIRYGNIFGLTFVVVLFGLVRYFLRRRRKLEDEL